LSLDFACFSAVTGKPGTCGDSGDEKTLKCPSQYIFFHALKNCRKLRILQFELRCAKGFYFEEADGQEFVQAVSTSSLKALQMPLITFDCSTFASHLVSLRMNNLMSLKMRNRYHEGLTPSKFSSLSLCEDLTNIVDCRVSLRGTDILFTAMREKPL
jgi:hypothetical protein